MSFLLSAALLAVITAVACALPGVFIVLRRNSMLVDAISHAVLPGIVFGYFLTHNLHSPLLILCAALAGLVVVLGSEWLADTGLITGDAPQGLIFPALFSTGILLLTAEFSHVHLDTHTVLTGDLNLAAWDQLIIGGVSVGAAYMYVMLGILLLNALFITVFYYPLKTSTFDPSFAQGLGMRTRLLNTAFLFLVSMTVTAAFNAAGAILVVALVVVPAATAYLLSSRLSHTIALTVLIAAAGAAGGFWLAYILNAATSAGMSVFYGVLFLVVLAATRIRQRRHQRRQVTAGGQVPAGG